MFSKLNLSNELQEAINDVGYTQPTDIQAKTIPLLLENDQDLIAQAATGTGKTAAFVIPLLEKINQSQQNIQALILTPSRELAKQIDGEIEKLSKYKKIKSVAIYGGARYDRQLSDIRNKRPQIIVGTPGRLLDLIKRGSLNFSKARNIILDEADEMLNMGFWEDVQTLIDEFPENRNLWMFSATMPRPILKLVEKHFDNPQFIKAEKANAEKRNIEQRYYLVRNRQRAEGLNRIIQFEKDVYGIVFCCTKNDTTELGEFLISKGFSADVLNGDLNQGQREKALARFRQRRVQLLICTDVASRGIDVNDVTHVFNYGLPRDLESYVHRIGRTGRAGAKGIAISLVSPDDFHKVAKLERVTQATMQKEKFPTLDQLKKAVVDSELQKLNTLQKKKAESIEKGTLSEEVADPSFQNFSDSLSGLSKEEILELFFFRHLKRDLRKIDRSAELENLSVEDLRRGRDRKSGRGRIREGGRGRERFRDRDRGASRRRSDFAGERFSDERAESRVRRGEDSAGRRPRQHNRFESESFREEKRSFRSRRGASEGTGSQKDFERNRTDFDRNQKSRGSFRKKEEFSRAQRKFDPTEDFESLSKDSPKGGRKFGRKSSEDSSPSRSKVQRGGRRKSEEGRGARKSGGGSSFREKARAKSKGRKSGGSIFGGGKSGRPT